MTVEIALNLIEMNSVKTEFTFTAEEQSHDKHTRKKEKKSVNHDLAIYCNHNNPLFNHDEIILTQ